MEIPNLVEKLYNTHKKNIRRFPCHTNRASAIGSPCERQLVYMRVAWEQAELTSLTSQLIFDEGNEHERIVMRDLLESGVKVIEQQTAFKDDLTNTTGHLDAVIEIETVKDQVVVGIDHPPLEFKSCSPFIFDALARYGEDEYMKAMSEMGEDYSWLKKYPAQILLYCYAKASKYGIIIFKNKSNGQMKQFILNLEENMDYLSTIFEKAKRVNKAVALFYNTDGSKKFEVDSEDAKKLLPAKINDPVDCKYCDYNVLCNPDITFGNPLKVENNPIIEKAIDEHFLFNLYRKAYDKRNEFLKVACKDVDNVIVGKWHVAGKYNKNGAWLKKITIADEMKMLQIKEEEERIKKIIDSNK